MGVTIVVLCGLVLLPALPPAIDVFGSSHILGWALLVAGILAASTLISGIIANASSDPSALRSIAIGTGVAFWAGAYANVDVIRHRFDDAGLAEFQDYQAATVGIVLCLSLFASLRSSFEVETVILRLGKDSLKKTLTDLADLTGRPFRKFNFAVETTDDKLKLVLLSRTTATDEYYTVHTLKTTHEATSQLWSIFNLSMLDTLVTNAWPKGEIEQVETGSSGILECKMVFTVKTVTAETKFNQFSKSAGPAFAVQDLHNLQERVIDSADILGAFDSNVKAAIGDSLDVIATNTAAQMTSEVPQRIASLEVPQRIASMAVLKQRLKVEADKLKFQLDKAFKTIDIAAELTLPDLGSSEKMVTAVFEAYDSAIESFGNFQISVMPNVDFDRGVVTAELALNERVSATIASGMRSLAVSSSEGKAQSEGTISLLSFVELNLKEVKVFVTAEAEAFRQSVNTIYDDVKKQLDAKETQVREAIMRRGTVTKEFLDTVLKSPLPSETRRAILEHAFNADQRLPADKPHPKISSDVVTIRTDDGDSFST